MNEALKKADKYQKRYMQKHRMLCVCLDKEIDKDIIEWMNEQASISNAVRRALRSHINGREECDGNTERETPAGDQKTEGSNPDNSIKTSEDRLPEENQEAGKGTEDIRPSAANSRTCKTCRASRIDYLRQVVYCDNEESEKAGMTTQLTDTCGAWR